MPRLVLFAPCEKVLISDNNAASLINTLFGGNVRADVSTAPDPSDLTVPMNWSVFCLWERTPSDTGKSFDVSVQLVFPSGRLATDQGQNFAMDRHYHRTIATATNFPVGEAGRYTIRLMMKEHGAADDPVELASCIINVHHSLQNEGES